MKLRRESNILEVFQYIENVEENPTSVILFVDQSALCESYTKQAWLQQENVQVVEVDQEIIDTLQIGKVPQFRFYVAGTEVHDLIGTASYETFLTRKKELLTPRKFKVSNIKQPISATEVEL